MCHLANLGELLSQGRFIHSHRAYIKKSLTGQPVFRSALRYWLFNPGIQAEDF